MYVSAAYKNHITTRKCLVIKLQYFAIKLFFSLSLTSLLYAIKKYQYNCESRAQSKLRPNSMLLYGKKMFVRALLFFTLMAYRVLQFFIFIFSSLRRSLENRIHMLQFIVSARANTRYIKSLSSSRLIRVQKINLFFCYSN